MTDIKFKIKETKVKDLKSGDFFVFGDSVYLVLDSQFDNCRVFNFDSGNQAVFVPDKVVNPLNATILLNYQEDMGDK